VPHYLFRQCKMKCSRTDSHLLVNLLDSTLLYSGIYLIGLTVDIKIETKGRQALSDTAKLFLY
jgi:hypothetical protein